MSLADRLAATVRRPTATVRLGGARWRDVLSLSRNQSFGQGVSGGEVVGRNPPVTVVEGETTISWSWGYDGEEVAGFSGVVSKILQRSYPNQWRLQVADPLWLADIRRKDIATDPLNSIAASAAITQILSDAGLTRLSIPALPASGSEWVGDEWVLGTLTPVEFGNTTALAAAQAICEVLGFWLYADASGVVRATAIERRPSDSPFRTLRWGVDFLLAGPPERERDASSVKNRVVVRGANTGVQGAQIRDEWQAGDADRTLEYTSALIEYVNESEAGAASATGVAKRILRVWSRQPNVIRIGRLKADPRLAVGMTLAIECALIGYASAKPFFVYSLQTSLDLTKGDFAQSLTLDGGTGDQGYTTLPPPEASFAWRLVAETLDGVAVIEVFLDGTASHSLGDGAIVSYAWESATAVESGYSDTATGARAMFVYPAATATVEISLTVTDTSSKTGSITQTVPLAGDATTPVATRVISVALGSAWAVTPDGGAAWNVEATGDSTLVPEIGGSELLSTAGTGSTDLRSSADALASASLPLADLGGQITALSQTEDAPERVWAAVGASLYRSIDGGATFTLWGTLPAPASAVLEDPAVLNSVFVLAGADMLHSTLDTPGTAWSVLYAGPTGATARHLVRGASGATTWIAYTGTFVGSPLQRVEGPITALFDPPVAEIRAIALSPDELSVYAWDADGNGYQVDSATGVATALAGATLAAGETAQHALHDPDDPIVYLATFGTAEGTVYKYFPLADSLAAFYVPAAGQQAHRVGLGLPPRLAMEFLVLTDGATPGGVWHLTAGGWALKNSGLPSGWTWLQVAVSPFSPDDWLILGQASGGVARGGGFITSDGEPILYRTTNAGASWTAIPIADPPQNSGSALRPLRSTPSCGYTSTGQLFFAASIFADYAWLWTGTDSLTVQATTGELANVDIYSAIAGRDGDVVLSLLSSPTQQVVRYVLAGGSTFLAGSSSPLDISAAVGGPLALGRIGLGRRVVVGLGGYKTLADYRVGTATPDDAIETLDSRLAIGYGDAFTAGTGMRRISGLESTPVVDEVAAFTGVGITALASDDTQQVLAALTGGASVLTVHWTEDGATWSATPGPTGGDLQVSALGVITR